MVLGVYVGAVLHFAADAAFDELLTTWRNHELNRRRADASVTDLASTRTALDRARNRMHRLRLSLHPESHECEAIVESLWCDALEAVVHFRWIDRDRDRPGNFDCPCGQLVGIDWNRVGSPPAR